LLALFGDHIDGWIVVHGSGRGIYYVIKYGYASNGTKRNDNIA